jgi:hypothetical protein
MIDLLKNLGDLENDTQRLRALLQEALKEEQDPGARAFLQDMHGALGESIADLKQTLPAAQVEIDRDMAALRQGAAQLQGGRRSASRAAGSAPVRSPPRQAAPRRTRRTFRPQDRGHRAAGSRRSRRGLRDV